MNTYNKIVKFLNQNSLNYTEKLNTYNKMLSIDGLASNNLFFVCLSNKTNSRAVITDYTYDIENTYGELCTIENRISYNKLMEYLGELIKYGI